MANQLKMAVVDAIWTLNDRGWSRRRIARELGINRGTVNNCINCGRGRPKPATNAPPGASDSKPAIAPPGSQSPTRSRSGPVSQCETLREPIEEKLKQGLSCQRIYQDLCQEYDFAGSYYSVRRFANGLREDSPIPFRRMACLPGEEAQVDFGTGAMIVKPDGSRKRPSVFRIVLGFSRTGYSEAVYRQTTDAFISCIENALWYFGGVPKALVIDNLKAAVRKADWYDPDIHPKIQSFCAHYGTVVLPTKPYTPRHKGKIERGIDYVQENALKGHRFVSLQAQNQHLLDWESRVADTRIHGTTRQQVGKLFREQEKDALLPLPPGRFPSFQEAQRAVHRDGHIEVQKAYYSVPPEYTARKVWARWDGHLVRIFNSRMESIAVHVQVEPGGFQTQQQHIHSQKRSTVEKGTRWMLQKAAQIGPHVGSWSQAMLETRGIPGIRVLVGLLNLASHYEDQQIDQACQIALSHQAYRLRTLRQLIERGGIPQQEFEFIDEHPIIRSPSEYAAFVKASLQ